MIVRGFKLFYVNSLNILSNKNDMWKYFKMKSIFTILVFPYLQYALVYIVKRTSVKK